MSEKQKYPRSDALKVAKELCDRLTPFCERIIVAGSLRRRKLEVGDVEILFIPKITHERDGLFDTVPTSAAEVAIQKLLDAEILTMRPSKTGGFSWGKLNKLAIHRATGIPVDLFATNEDCWYVSKVIRTGGKETNLMLTTGAHKFGRTLHAYGSGFTGRDGQLITCKSEEEVFELAGVPYTEPWNRI